VRSASPAPALGGEPRHVLEGEERERDLGAAESDSDEAARRRRGAEEPPARAAVLFTKNRGACRRGDDAEGECGELSRTRPEKGPESQGGGGCRERHHGVI